MYYVGKVLTTMIPIDEKMALIKIMAFTVENDSELEVLIHADQEAVSIGDLIVFDNMFLNSKGNLVIDKYRVVEKDNVNEK